MTMSIPNPNLSGAASIERLKRFAALSPERRDDMLRKLSPTGLARFAALAAHWLSMSIGASMNSAERLAEPRPRGAPKYWSRDHNQVLQHNFTSAALHESINAVMAEMQTIDSDPAITALAHETHAAGTVRGSIFGPRAFDRYHDIGEFAGTVCGVARSIQQHRKAVAWRVMGFDRDGVQAKSGKRETVAQIHGRFDAPAALIRGLAVQAVARWLPAMQNIITRLPATERDAAAAAAQLQLGHFIHTLGKLHAMALKANDEYARWDTGFGAVDMGILHSFTMSAYARDVARRMVAGPDDARFVEQLHKEAIDANAHVDAALNELSVERSHVMDLFAWNKRKAELAEFGRADGGMVPALEVMYHARGSKFIGY